MGWGEARPPLSQQVEAGLDRNALLRVLTAEARMAIERHIADPTLGFSDLQAAIDRLREL